MWKRLRLWWVAAAHSLGSHRTRCAAFAEASCTAADVAQAGNAAPAVPLAVVTGACVNQRNCPSKSAFSTALMSISFGRQGSSQVKDKSEELYSQIQAVNA
jgi:hypothetical protein